MSSSVTASRRPVMSWGCTSRISPIVSQLVMRTAQVSPSSSPRVTNRMSPPLEQVGHRSCPGRKRKRPGLGVAPGVVRVRWCESLDLGDVRCAGSLGAVHDLEPHLVAFVEGAEALGPDLRMVHENVRPAFPGQETETLRLVEPLHRTFDHERAGLLSPCLAASSPARP